MLSEDHWDQENLNRELTRALITVENARKEWISNIPKFPVLDPKSEAQIQPEKTEVIKKPENVASKRKFPPFADMIDFKEFSWKQWAQCGLALTWPIAAVRQWNTHPGFHLAARRVLMIRSSQLIPFDQNICS